MGSLKNQSYLVAAYSQVQSENGGRIIFKIEVQRGI